MYVYIHPPPAGSGHYARNRGTHLNSEQGPDHVGGVGDDNGFRFRLGMIQPNPSRRFNKEILVPLN